MMKCNIRYLTFVLLLLITIISCKKEEANYYEYGIPAFAVYQKSGEPESFYAYCASHDVYMDSVYVTSPINVKSRMYLHGQQHSKEIHFLIGDTFVPSEGKWTFVFYGRKVVNNLNFQSFYENSF